MDKTNLTTHQLISLCESYNKEYSGHTKDYGKNVNRNLNSIVYVWEWAT